MSKKIIMACMAVVALAAFALPASALAANEPQLTENGSLVPVETGGVKTKILATNEGNTLLLDTSGNTLVTCSTAKLTGELTKNSANTVEGKITSALFGGTGAQRAGEPEPECTGSLGDASVTAQNLPWNLKSTPLMKTHEFQVSAASGKIKFQLIVTGPFGSILTCNFEANNNALTGSYTTNTSIHTMTVTASAAGSGFTLVPGSSFGCPSSGYLEMAFNLETHAPGNPQITWS